MTSPISSTAQAAREQSRAPDGRFGTQPATEADLDVDPGRAERAELRARLAAAVTPEDVTDQDVDAMFRHDSGPDLPESWASTRDDHDDELTVTGDDHEYEEREGLVVDAWATVQVWTGRSGSFPEASLSDWDEQGNATLSVRHGGGQLSTTPFTAHGLVGDAGTRGEARTNAARAVIAMSHELGTRREAAVHAAHQMRVHGQGEAARAMRAPEGERPTDPSFGVRGWAVQAAYPGLDEDEWHEVTACVERGDDDLDEVLDRARDRSDRWTEKEGTVEAGLETRRAVRKILEHSGRHDVSDAMRLAFPNVDPFSRQRQTDRLVAMQGEYAGMSVERFAEHGQALDDRIDRLTDAQQNAAG